MSKNGILLENNHPQNISKSILKIINNKTILSKFRYNSISKVEEKFSSEIVFEKLVKTIKMTIS